MTKLINGGEYRHMHNHQTKQTLLRLELNGHVIRTWPWIPGMLTLKQVKALSLIPKLDLSALASKPVYLSIPEPRS